MNNELQLAIKQAIADVTGDASAISSIEHSRGGCINIAQIWTLEDGRRFFIKTNSQCPMDLFECEAVGLEALAATGAVNVPEVVGLGRSAKSIFLVLSVVDSGKKSTRFFETLGEQLAEMHRVSSEDSSGRFGYERQNYIGSTVQPNSWNSNWCQFWLENRLRFQVELANKNGRANREFNRLVDRLADRLDGIVVTDELPCLIHGDLWSGNYMVGVEGQPVLIDPAVYFGHREAEFGMTTLFGGFDDRFYNAYNANWPLADGAEDRIAIYRLYHLMNHLNIFGDSYMDGCLRIIRRFV